MVLTRSLLRAAAATPAAMPVVPAGATAVRLALERELRARSWPVAATPATASLLVACGRPGPDLAAAADRVWRQMSPPRARVEVAAPEQVTAALDRARHDAADLALQRRLLADDGPEPDHHEEKPPGGLAMAERAPDRDGLALDQLHLALGPVLVDWPAGLVLRLVVQGDVVQQADAECLDAEGGGAGAYWRLPWRRAAAGEPVARGEAARWVLARSLDSASRLLAVAGWEGVAVTGRRLRDEVLAGAGPGTLLPRYRRFQRRVAGSWTLRWLTRGLGRLDPAGAAAFGFAPPPAGDSDVWDRLSWWLAQAALASELLDDQEPLAGRLGTGDLHARPPQGGVDGAWALGLLARLVTGTELAATRLVVASLDPDLDRFSPAGRDGDAGGDGDG